MKPLCTAQCPKYNPGGIGERFCSDGLFDERTNHKKPTLEMENMAVITPSTCSRSKSRIPPYINPHRYRR